MALKKEVVIFYGPPHSGKTTLFYEQYSETHGRVSPLAEFEQNPNWTLRQMIMNKIISPLRKGTNIVIDDENWSASKRKSYIILIKSKVPDCKFKYVAFNPKHGATQMLWQHEFYRSEHFLTSRSNSTYQRNNRVEEKIKTWTSKSKIVETIPPPEDPSDSEGIRIEWKNTRLQTCVEYKFEVPCLFLQWEGIAVGLETNKDDITSIKESIKKWYKCNPCGRIIVILDGTGHHQTPHSETKSKCERSLTNLAEELTDCPLYLFSQESSSHQGRFGIPPNPGIIAFLQRLHHLDLQNKGTIYVYHSLDHKKMAENAGVKHIKATRVWSHPALVQSSHGTETPPTPDVLQDLIIKPCKIKNYETAEIPLYKDSGKGGVCLDVGQGQNLQLFYKDLPLLKKYQSLYAENACCIDNNSHGKISKLSKQHSAIQIVKTEVSQEKASSSLQKSSSFNRDIPKWMLAKTKTSNRSDKTVDNGSLEDASTLEEVESIEPNTKKTKLKSAGSLTVYIMGEEELLNTAKLILSEAGEAIPEEEEVATFLREKTETGSKIDNDEKEFSDVKDSELSKNFNNDGETTKHKVMGNLCRKKKRTCESLIDRVDDSAKVFCHGPMDTSIKKSFVSETITTIPETVLDKTAEKWCPLLKKEDSYSNGPDLSILDGII